MTRKDGVSVVRMVSGLLLSLGVGVLCAGSLLTENATVGSKAIVLAVFLLAVAHLISMLIED